MKSTDSVTNDDEEKKTAAGLPEPEAEAEKAFTEIFRPRKRLNGEERASILTLLLMLAFVIGVRSTSSGPHPPTIPAPSAATRLLEAPPHVLPPSTTVCTHLMRRLLPPAMPPSGSSHAPSRKEDSSEEEERLEERLSSGEEEEVRPPKKRSHSKHPQPPPNQETESGRGSVKCKASNYQWLVNYFQKST